MTSQLHSSLNVAIESGQFLKAEPGAARLLSVLSLQSLPRRLAFDFRDLFEEGFAFDSVTGDVSIAEGVARTNNLRMRGAAAVVLMEGSADIIRETLDGATMYELVAAAEGMQPEPWLTPWQPKA